MNISDEAVEAAARRIYAASGQDVSGWVYMAPEHPRRMYCLEVAKETLEAAAPHLLAQAWDEAYDNLVDEHGSMKWEYAPRTNPYRSAGAGE